MNPDFSPSPREALEAKLTALLLGELPAEEAAALRQSIAHDANLAKLYARLKLTIGLVTEAAANPANQATEPAVPLKLADQRREELLQHFKTVRPKEFAKPRRREVPWVVPMSIAAVLVAIIGLLTLMPIRRGRPFFLSRVGDFFAPAAQTEVTEAKAAVDSLSRESLNEPAQEQFAFYRRYGESRRLEAQASSKSETASAPDVSRAPNQPELIPSRRTPEQLRAGLEDSRRHDLVVVAGQPAAKSTLSTIVLPSGGDRVEALNAPAPGAALPNLAYSDSASITHFYDDSGTKTKEVKDAFLGAAVPVQGIASDGATMDGDQQRKQKKLGTASGTIDELSRARLNEALENQYDPRRYGSLSLKKPEGVPPQAVSIQPRAPQATAGASVSEDALAKEAAKGAVTVASAVDPNTGLPVATPTLAGGGLGGFGGGGGAVTIAPTSPSVAFSVVIGGAAKAAPSARPEADQQEIAQRLETATTEKAPMLGDLPLLGKIFRQKVEASENRDQAPAAQGPTQETRLGNEADKQEAEVGGRTKSRAMDEKADSNGLMAGNFGDKTVELQVESREGAEQKLALNDSLVGDPHRVGVLERNRGESVTERKGREPSSADHYGFDHRLSPSTPTESGAEVVGRPLSRGQAGARQMPPAPDNAPAMTLSSETLERVEALSRKLNKQTKTVQVQKDLEELRKEIERARQQESDLARNTRPSIPPPIPQPEVAASDNAFSTFSLNVSDVSFKLAAASLEKGQMPDPSSIRSEEFINAFDYRDPEAPAGVPIAFAWERSQYPFAQNRDLLRFSVKTAAQGRQSGQPLNLVLLLDNSGSMERADRVQIIHEALKVLAAQLQPQDKLSVVTFARSARLWVDGAPGDQADQVAEEVSGLTPQGGTNIEEAMNLAYQTALRHYLTNGVNRVVLLTDGAANLGNVEPEVLKQKVEANRKQGVALDCFGIGWEGYNDDLLEVLTRNGDGRYGFINTPEEAATEFAGQLAGALHVAAADVKVQVEFNPARVTAYRQIGYAKHQLTKEQFRDNTVDAAEIGAKESGNALYVIETNPRGEGPLGVVRVRYKVPGTGEYREQEWAAPYNGNPVPLEQAGPAMRLAAAASGFSEWLASSPYAGEVNPDRLLSYLSGVPEVYGADGRPKKLEWMIRQAKSLAGK